MSGALSAVRARRGLLLLASVVVPFALVAWGGHVGVHMARNLLFPGAGIVDHSIWLAVAFAVLAVAATVLWLQWGAGWLLAMVVVASTAVAGLLAGSHPDPEGTTALLPVRSAHEFPLVVLVIAAVAWARSALGRVPGLRRVVVRRSRARSGLVDLASLKPVDRCRAASIALLAGADAQVHTAWANDVRRRARRVGVVARLRLGGDPYRRDHTAARTAQLLGGVMDEASVDRLCLDASRTPLGVPCSEPTWVRPLDATLAAIALQRSGRPAPGDAWAIALQERFRLRRGHRAAWWWTPLDVGAASAPAWEHAAFSGLARAVGWIDADEDWVALRRSALGAAARGADHPEDERLIAAARIWLAFVDDAEAQRIVMRPGVRHDPLACALDRLAARLCDNRDVLRHGPDVGSTGGRLP